MLGALLANMALFRVLRAFLAGFGVVCVGLFVLRALRGLWGFCAREWLGGLETCGVFASIFQLLCPSFCLFVLRFISLPCLLSFFALIVFACPLVLSLLS